MTQTKTEAAIKTSRMGYLGGSDVAAILGLSRWDSPLSVWSEKTGAIAPEDISRKLHIRLGHRMEQVVAELFEEETGKKVRRDGAVRIHPKYPYLRAQIDRLVVGEDEVLECKTASGYKAKEWEDADVPGEYILQCLHQLMVTGKERAYIACLIGGNQEFTWKIIERDEAMISEMLEREVHFWEKFVVPKVMPNVSAMDAPTLYGLFPLAHEGETVELPTEALGAITRYKEIGTEKTGLLGELMAEKELLGNQLRAMLGEAETGVSDKWKVTWKNQSTGVRLDTERIKLEAPEVYDKFGKAGDCRMLRISDTTPKPKKGK